MITIVNGTPSQAISEKQEAVCFGTKERDPCNCGGDKNKCTYYEEVREKAKTNYEIACDHVLDITENHLSENDRKQFWILMISCINGKTKFDDVIDYVEVHYKT